MLAGFRTSASIILEQLFEEIDVEYKAATDDGSRGFKGLVTELLDRELDKNAEKSVAVYTCGPEPMLRRVAEITVERDVPCELSLEQRMACGVGACLVCACSTKTPDGGNTYKMVCKDGPVFNARDVVFE
jgi:dihydroorotate dehydrogenase electron transfer subunit